MSKIVVNVSSSNNVTQWGRRKKALVTLLVWLHKRPDFSFDTQDRTRIFFQNGGPEKQKK